MFGRASDRSPTKEDSRNLGAATQLRVSLPEGAIGAEIDGRFYAKDAADGTAPANPGAAPRLTAVAGPHYVPSVCWMPGGGDGSGGQ